MKPKALIIFIIICVLIIITIIATLVVLKSNTSSKTEEIEPRSSVEVVEEPIVVFLDEKEKEVVEEEPQIHVKDAAELTQEIYDINGPIGVLNIPKTGLNTQIFSRVTANKMEKMPCFLYTTGGLNNAGTTVFVGHNRDNGLLFSNNKLLEENDEIIFTDLNGVEKKYTIYSKFITESDDVSYYNTGVNSPVIVMQCCLTPTNEEQVLIIMAKAEN